MYFKHQAVLVTTSIRHANKMPRQSLFGLQILNVASLTCDC